MTDWDFILTWTKNLKQSRQVFCVVILSFGCPAIFDYFDLGDGKFYSIVLLNGSILIMGAKHRIMPHSIRIPETKHVSKLSKNMKELLQRRKRISVTIRVVHTPNSNIPTPRDIHKQQNTSEKTDKKQTQTPTEQKQGPKSYAEAASKIKQNAPRGVNTHKGNTRPHRNNQQPPRNNTPRNNRNVANRHNQYTSGYKHRHNNHYRNKDDFRNTQNNNKTERTEQKAQISRSSSYFAHREAHKRAGNRARPWISPVARKLQRK